MISLDAVTTHLQQTLNPVISRLIKPEVLGRIATKMPLNLNTMIVQKLLNSTFNEQINEGDFEFLEGRKLQLEVIDARLFVGLSFTQKKINCFHFSNQACAADVILSIDTLNAIELIQQEIDPDTLFFQRKLRINGDTELAHHVKNTIDTLDPDVIPDILLKMISGYKSRVLSC